MYNNAQLNKVINNLQANDFSPHKFLSRSIFLQKRYWGNLSACLDSGGFVDQSYRWGQINFKATPGRSTASSLCRWSRSCGVEVSLQLQPVHHWNWCVPAGKTWSTGTAPLGRRIWTKLRNLPGGTQGRQRYGLNSENLSYYNLVIIKNN